MFQHTRWKAASTVYCGCCGWQSRCVPGCPPSPPTLGVMEAAVVGVAESQSLPTHPIPYSEKVDNVIIKFGFLILIKAVQVIFHTLRFILVSQAACNNHVNTNTINITTLTTAFEWNIIKITFNLSLWLNNHIYMWKSRRKYPITPNKRQHCRWHFHMRKWERASAETGSQVLPEFWKHIVKSTPIIFPSFPKKNYLLLV